MQGALFLAICSIAAYKLRRDLMDHIRLLKEENEEPLLDGKKSLLNKAVGRFYTHEIIGRHLAAVLLRIAAERRQSSVRLVDPFCGDGRLVVWLLERANKITPMKLLNWEVHVWDCEQDAVEEAHDRIHAKAHELGVRVRINARRIDSFLQAPPHYGQFDMVVTNPPWEILKPDKRELQLLTPRKALDYVEKLRERNKKLSFLFPISKPKLMFSGWGTNLARLGTEIALRLTRHDGICGIVSPASLFADQMSEELRRWIFANFKLTDIAYDPAESRLFVGVDQPAISIVAVPGDHPSYSARIAYFQDTNRYSRDSRLLIRRDQLDAEGAVLPLQLGVAGVELLSNLRRWPQWATFENAQTAGLWAGRELDETGHEQFLDTKGDFLFLKGRMVKRFGLAEQPLRFVRRDGPRIPESASFWRIAWRDVARPSQKRRMHATLIPPGWVTGNSLSVAYFRDHNRDRLLALLATMNSLIFEFQVKAYLATAHVSLGSVRKVRIPNLHDKTLVKQLARLGEACIRNYTSVCFEFEGSMARAYGLTLNEFRSLLRSFQKIDTAEQDCLLQAIQ